MVRPRLCRDVNNSPEITYFKPRGVPLFELKEVVLTIDEYESIRLNDLEQLNQEDCAKKMNISQPTFHRLVVSARKKIADSIINGKALRITGGNFKIVNKICSKKLI
jgi:uncharacterized protein